MNEQNYAMSEDMVIDLVDLFFSLLKKWRSLLVLILIGAIVGGGLGYVKGQPAEAAMLETPTANVEQALLYHKLVEQQLDYNEGSLLMQMDPNSVYIARLTYYISHPDNPGFQSAATAAYEGLLDQVLLTRMREASGLKCEARYFSELVTVGRDPLAVPEKEHVDVEPGMENCVEFRILSTSRASCQSMLEVLTDGVEELEYRLTAQFPGVEAYVVTSSVEQAAYNEIHRYQINNADRVKTLQTSLNTAVGALDDLESACYHQLLTGENPNETPATLDKGTVAKWLIIGVFLGIVAWGGWFVVAYLLDSRVKTASELQDTYRIPLLGRLEGANRAKGIDKWLQSLQNKTKRAAVSEAYLTELIANLEAGPVVLCGDRGDGELSAVLDRLAHGQLTAVPLLGTDAAALTQATQTGKLILLVRTGKTTRKVIQRELELCRMQKIRLLGMIVID